MDGTYGSCLDLTYVLYEYLSKPHSSPTLHFCISCSSSTMDTMNSVYGYSCLTRVQIKRSMCLHVLTPHARLVERKLVNADQAFIAAPGLRVESRSVTKACPSPSNRRIDAGICFSSNSLSNASTSCSGN